VQKVEIKMEKRVLTILVIPMKTLFFGLSLIVLVGCRYGLQKWTALRSTSGYGGNENVCSGMPSSCFFLCQGGVGCEHDCPRSG
jgi:hypothetical protein